MHAYHWFEGHIFATGARQDPADLMSHKYEIELDCFTRIYDAKEFCDKYSGLPNIKVIQQTSYNKTLYYVRIGKYNRWLEAKKYLTELNSSFPELQGSIVMRLAK